ncbi:MAG: FtsL-like putative cell division protein [Thermodesulfobacteriota bacterium]|nr:FtsL-like putative cell division protein [Thermodesulfobacteriota bacterium]
MSLRSATIRIPQRRLYVPMAQKNNTGSSFSFSKVLEITRQKTIAFIFALAALLILGFWTTHETRKIAKDIEFLQIEEGRLSIQYQDFNTQMNQLKARSRMEKWGGKMGLHPPTDRQTISLN